jgi:hypothetical protein
MLKYNIKKLYGFYSIAKAGIFPLRRRDVL